MTNTSEKTSATTAVPEPTAGVTVRDLTGNPLGTGARSAPAAAVLAHT